MYFYITLFIVAGYFPTMPLSRHQGPTIPYYPPSLGPIPLLRVPSSSYSLLLTASLYDPVSGSNRWNPCTHVHPCQGVPGGSPSVGDRLSWCWSGLRAREQAAAPIWPRSDVRAETPSRSRPALVGPTSETACSVRVTRSVHMCERHMRTEQATTTLRPRLGPVAGRQSPPSPCSTPRASSRQPFSRGRPSGTSWGASKPSRARPASPRARLCATRGTQLGPSCNAR